MPIKPIPPREGFSPNWYARGTYIGVFVDRSTKTVDKREARLLIKKWEREIERGEYRDPRKPEVATDEGPKMFLAAAVAYMNAGGERAFLRPILDEWREKRLDEIDQILVDATAEKLYGGRTAATKNRQFYTPVSAILKRAGIEKSLKRPKGWRGQNSTSWLEPDQAFALFAAADVLDREFGLFLRTLCYTGMRLSEALGVQLSRLDLSRQAIYLPETKNGHSRTVFLPDFLVADLASHPRGLDRSPQERVFRYHAGGRLRDLLKDAMKNAGLSFPRRQGGFHIFCHTYGTWMHRFGGLDNFGLSRTDRWRDPRSAERYLHTEFNSEARIANHLPIQVKKR